MPKTLSGCPDHRHGEGLGPGRSAHRVVQRAGLLGAGERGEFTVPDHIEREGDGESLRRLRGHFQGPFHERGRLLRDAPAQRQRPDLRRAQLDDALALGLRLKQHRRRPASGSSNSTPAGAASVERPTNSVPLRYSMPSESPFSINAGRTSTTSALAVRDMKNKPHTRMARRGMVRLLGWQERSLLRWESSGDPGMCQPFTRVAGRLVQNPLAVVDRRPLVIVLSAFQGFRKKSSSSDCPAWIVISESRCNQGPTVLDAPFCLQRLPGRTSR